VARSRQVIGPRRVVLFAVLNPDDPDRRLVVIDDAVNHKASDIPGYVTSFYDTSKLVFRPGEQPSWFTIAPVSMAQKLAAPPRGRETELARAAWFVRCGLVRIDGYVLTAADGSQAPVAQPDRKAHGKLGEVASEEWLAECGLTEHDVMALGAMIEFISEAQGPSSRRSAEPSGDGAAKTATTEPTSS